MLSYVCTVKLVIVEPFVTAPLKVTNDEPSPMVALIVVTADAGPCGVTDELEAGAEIPTALAATAIKV